MHAYILQKNVKRINASFWGGCQFASWTRCGHCWPTDRKGLFGLDQSSLPNIDQTVRILTFFPMTNMRRLANKTMNTYN